MTRRNVSVVSIVMFAVFSASSVVAGTTYTVDPATGEDTVEDGNTVFATLGFALTKVGAGDIVQLARGTHTFTGPLSCSKANLTISGCDPEDPRATVLDGQGLAGGLSLTGSGTTIEYFTISNCTGFADGKGSGLNMKNSTIESCVVTCCTNVYATKALMGGGVYMESCACKNTIFAQCEGRAESANQSYGGGGYFKGGVISGCSFRGNCLSNKSGATYKLYGGGAYFTGSAVVESCVFDGNEVVNRASSSGGWGGGAAGDGASFTNCLFLANKAPVYGSAVTDGATGPLGLYACTISNNVITAAKGNCGAVTLLHGGRINGCLVADNAVLNTTAAHYGCGVTFAGGSSGMTFEISDSAVVGNVGSSDASKGTKGAGVYGASPTVDLLISNVLVSGNSGVSTTPNGIYITGSKGRVRIVDSLISANIAGGIRYDSSNTGTSVEPSFMRQCIVTRNTGDAAVDVRPVGNQFMIEGCSIVSNDCGSAAVLHTQTAEQAGNIRVKGCVLADNLAASDFKTTFAGYEDNISYVFYMNPSSKISLSPELHNVMMPRSPFMEAGGVLLRKRAEPIDAFRDEADIPTWMNERGAKDLGNGTYVLEKVRDYGVHIAYCARRPRILNGHPDAGATEYQPEGLMLLVR